MSKWLFWQCKPHGIWDFSPGSCFLLSHPLFSSSFPSFPIISVSHGELACQAAPLLCIASHVLIIFLDLSVASHTIAHSLYFALLLWFPRHSFWNFLLPFWHFILFFAGHSSFTKPLHGRLSWGSVLGSIFPHGYFMFSSALDTSGLV